MDTTWLRSSCLSHDLACCFVSSHPKQARMPELSMHRPFNEADVHNNLRTHPMCPQARQPDSFGKWWLRYLQMVQLCAQIQKQFGVEAGADLSGEDEVVSFKVTNQKRPEANTLALRIGEPTHNEFLRHLA